MQRTRHILRSLAVVSSRLTFLWVVAVVAPPAFAQAILGQGLLDWLANYILPGLVLFSALLALATAMFNPMVAKGAFYVALVGAALFFLVRQGGSFVGALR